MMEPRSTPIRVMIADDHAIFRQGLRSLLALQREMRMVAEVPRASDLLSALATTSCDILLLDLQMERWMLDDIPALASLVRIVVLTASERIEDALAALRLGARAIVQKRYALDTLITALRSVADGLVWMPPELQAELAAQWGAPEAKKLTARESEIVRYVSMGLRNIEVAERMAISESTVKTHLNNIFHKLELRDRVELTLYAVRFGLVTVERSVR